MEHSKEENMIDVTAERLNAALDRVVSDLAPVDAHLHGMVTEKRGDTWWFVHPPSGCEVPVRIGDMQLACAVYEEARRKLASAVNRSDKPAFRPEAPTTT